MILDSINSPEDIRGLGTEQLKELCAEIRDYMIKCCAVNPGHLGSSLGAVELIVGLHYTFNTPYDKVVFDVGHQAYAHKIITGRKEIFAKNRTKGGISGFPRMDESEWDAFGTGHSSTSISAALGYAEAARILGNGERAVAFIGDGALTGGLAWEGLNNGGCSNADILVILNDNNISIDENIGAFHQYLTKLTTDPIYNKVKRHIWEKLGDGWMRDKLRNIVADTKSMLVRKSGGALFEALGFRYFGPIDGNDIEAVTETLGRLKDIHGPRILHALTKKGKGYSYAEEDPIIWHAPGKFNPETGVRILNAHPADRYQDVFGAVLEDLATNDERVVGVTPAMALGSGMTGFAHKFPERFFDVGIEEEHAVTFSAGLAAGGLKPFCNIYSSFAQRAYDEIIHDVALQDLPVVLCFDRGGLVGEDGATHNGCFDLAAFRIIPGCTIAAPSNEIELKNMMWSALQSKTGPYIIRYPRGCGEGKAWRNAPYDALEAGKAMKARDAKGCLKAAVLAIGPEVWRAVEAAERLEEETGQAPEVWDMRFLKPIDTELVDDIRKRCTLVVTAEEGSIKGGLYGEVCELMSPYNDRPKVLGCGIPDKFIVQDKQNGQRHDCGLDSEGILETLRKGI